MTIAAARVNHRAFFFTVFCRASCTLNLTMRVISVRGMRLSRGNWTEPFAPS